MSAVTNEQNADQSQSQVAEIQRRFDEFKQNVEEIIQNEVARVLAGVVPNLQQIQGQQNAPQQNKPEDSIEFRKMEDRVTELLGRVDVLEQLGTSDPEIIHNEFLTNLEAGSGLNISREGRHFSITASGEEDVDEKVGVDAEATPGYLGDLPGNGVLHTGTNTDSCPNMISKVDGGDFITVEHTDTSAAESTTNTSRNVIQNVGLDDAGHVTSLESVDLALTDVDEKVKVAVGSVAGYIGATYGTGVIQAGASDDAESPDTTLQPIIKIAKDANTVLIKHRKSAVVNQTCSSVEVISKMEFDGPPTSNGWGHVVNCEKRILTVSATDEKVKVSTESLAAGYIGTTSSTGVIHTGTGLTKTVDGTNNFVTLAVSLPNIVPSPVKLITNDLVGFGYTITDEAAKSDMWEAGTENGLSIYLPVKIVYSPTGGKILYLLWREFKWSFDGRLYSVGAMTRNIIDTPVEET